MFAWGIKRGLFRDDNPALGVDRLRRPHGQRQVNRPWLPSELEAMLAASSPRLRLALAVAAYTGLRESDVLRVTWAHYDGQAFETRTQKTGQRVWIPVHSRLRAILDAVDEQPEDQPIVCGFTSAGALRSSFYRLQHKLGLSGLSLHGLRHTLGTALAEAGCDAATIAAVLGHSTSQMAEHYSRHAKRDHLATVAFQRLEVQNEV